MSCDREPATLANPQVFLGEAQPVVAQVREPDPTADELLTVTTLTSSTDGVVVLRVVGEVDLFTLDRLREHLAKHVYDAHHPVVLDCTQVSFMAACGIGLLIEIADEARAKAVPLRLVVEGRRLMRLLKATGVDGQLLLAATVAEAVAQCKG